MSSLQMVSSFRLFASMTHIIDIHFFIAGDTKVTLSMSYLNQSQIIYQV